MRIARILVPIVLVFVAWTGLAADAPDWAWAKSIAGYNSQSGRGIAMDAAGNSYATGYYSDDTSFGAITLENDATFDTYVAKLGPAGNWIWVSSAGGDLGNIRSYAIAVDGSGNTFVTGNFSETVSFGTLSLTSTETSSGDHSADVFIAKLDPSGNWLWARKADGTYGDSGSGIAADASGNCIVTGFFNGPTTFGTTSLPTAGGGDIFVAKLDAAGNWLWAVRAGSAYSDSGYAIATDTAGNIYTTGYYSYPASFGTINISDYGELDVYVAKLDPNGTWLWVNKCGSTNDDYGRGISVDGSGNCYVAGDYYGSAGNPMRFGGTIAITLNSLGYKDVFVAKISSSGTWLWARRAGGSSEDICYGMDTDSNGNTYLAGVYGGTASFGATSLPADLNDIFAAKLDGEGNWLWAQKAGGENSDCAYGAAANDAGICSLTGVYATTAYFGSWTLYGNTFSLDSYVAVLDPAYGAAIPLAPEALAASVSGDDIFLDWEDVTEDSSGAPITVDHYLVRYHPSDPAGTFTTFGEDGFITLSQWTHTGAAALYGMGFYEVLAVTE